MAQPVPRTRLEQLAQRAHLTVADFVVRFHAAAVECGEKNAQVSERQATRWLVGEGGSPRPVCCRVLEHWWREPVARLLGPPESEAGSVVAAMTAEELIVNTGRESEEHAIKVAAALDPSALENLHSAVRRVGKASVATPPLEVFTDLVRLRNTVYDQLDRTRKPRQQAELYLLAGEVCGMLATMCFELGHPDVAEEQARAAYTYGNLIDHPRLCAWARLLQVYMMFSTGRPRRGADLAASALDTAPRGTSRASLYEMQGRSLALIGARQEVRAAFDAADDEMQHAGDDPFLYQLGAEAYVGHTTITISAAVSFIALGDGEQAETRATTALQLLSDTPEPDRWVAGELAARIDLATARTLRGELAGAEDALRPVFAVDPERRTEAVARRLGDLGRIVVMARYRDTREASRIGEAIEDFTLGRLPSSVTGPFINPAG